MKVEAWVFGILSVFLVVVTPIYWLMSEDPTGTTALVMTFFLSLTERFPQHRALAKYTYPLWMYVSVTGVVVYLMQAAIRR